MSSRMEAGKKLNYIAGASGGALIGGVVGGPVGAAVGAAVGTGIAHYMHKKKQG